MALEKYQADTLSIPDLQEFIKYHFVKGNVIFTDGKQPARYYETTRIDETTNEFSTYYSTIKIIPSIDRIELYDNDGILYLSIDEEEGKTNIMIANDTDSESMSIHDYITTGVVHQIDTVLIKKAIYNEQ